MDIQAHLNGIGTIRKGKDYCVFKVKPLKQVSELIKLFDQYPLISQKKANYILFKKNCHDYAAKGTFNYERATRNH
jgi:hypothetical protein